MSHRIGLGVIFLLAGLLLVTPPPAASGREKERPQLALQLGHFWTVTAVDGDPAGRYLASADETTARLSVSGTSGSPAGRRPLPDRVEPGHSPTLGAGPWP